jgi:lambda family phage tail tape measure protein
MSTTLGSLIVTLEANIAKFESDLGRAVTVAEANMNQISKIVGKASDAFSFLAAGLGVDKLVEFSASVLESTAHLAGLAMQTGLSVETLSGLSTQAAEVHLSIDDVASAFERLERQTALAVGGNQKAAAQFAAIGISAQQLAQGLKDPQSLLLAVSQNLEKFSDDGSKTALMMQILGRGGASMAQFLHNIATEGIAAASTTAEQARQAEAYEKDLADLSSTIKTFWQDTILTLVPAIKLGGATIITAFSDMWISVKYDAQIVFAWMADKLSTLADNAGNFLGIGNLVTGLPPAPHPSMVDSLAAQRDAAHAANAAIMAEAAADFVNSTRSPVQAPAAAKPSIAPPTVNNAGLQKLLDARLKVIQDAIKAEEAAVKTGNALLDQAYSQNLLSIADYSTAKVNMLNAEFAVTQRYYDQEIAIAQKFAAQQTDATAKQVALAKVQELADAKTADANKFDQERIALTDKIIADQQKLAKTVIDVSIAYATMNGNTELATKLQIDQADGVTKQILAANGLTDAYTKLVAVENDKMLRASQSGLDGMHVAVLDYQKGLADVAKSTNQMTTQMLQSMEDALVTFVTTGKLNFKSLIDSFIADLVRLMVRQQAMPFIAQLFGMVGGGGSGLSFTSNAGEASSLLDAMPAAANGNSWMVGGSGGTDSQMVRFKATPGERVLVQTPGQQARGNGVTVVNHNYIDARSDSAQIAQMIGQSTQYAIQQSKAAIVNMAKRGAFTAA